MVLLRRSIPFLLAFLGIYLAAFFTLCHITRKGTPLIHATSDVLLMKGGGSWQRFHEFDPDSTYDVVFIGSSHSYRGYDAGYFTDQGYTAFNLGSSAQTPMNSYYLVRDLLRAGHVGLLVMDVYEGTLENDGLESTADLVQNLPSDRTAWSMALATRDPRGLNMMALRYFMKEHAPFYQDSTYRAGGGAFRADSLKTDPDYAVGRGLHVRQRQAEFLEQVIALCRERGIRPVLCNHYFPHASDRRKHAAYNAYLHELLGADGPVYIDKAYDHQLSDRDHFFDHNHLNAAGARIFSADLLRELKERGLLPAH